MCEKDGASVGSVSIHKPGHEDVFIHHTGNTIREEACSWKDSLRMRRRLKGIADRHGCGCDMRFMAPQHNSILQGKVDYTIMRMTAIYGRVQANNLIEGIYTRQAYGQEAKAGLLVLRGITPIQ